jgi:hypothetical protein
MRAPSIVPVIMMAASCATVAPPAIDHVGGAGYAGVIFSAEYAHLHYYSQRLMWTPTRAIIAGFERRFARWLRDRRLSTDAVRPPKLQRQYLGMFDYQTGAKLLYVRFLGPVYPVTDLVLPDFEFIPEGATVGEAWFDPASKRIIDVGGSFGAFWFPGARDRSQRPPPPAPQPPPDGEPTPPSP